MFLSDNIKTEQYTMIISLILMREDTRMIPQAKKSFFLQDDKTSLKQEQVFNLVVKMPRPTPYQPEFDFQLWLLCPPSGNADSEKQKRGLSRLGFYCPPGTPGLYSQLSAPVPIPTTAGIGRQWMGAHFAISSLPLSITLSHTLFLNYIFKTLLH